MKHLFLINPCAGKYDRSREVLDKIHAVMSSRCQEWEAIVTEYPGHAEKLSRAAAERGDPVRIYACGGDGTLHEVAVGAAGFDNAAITAFPIGSGNDFIRMFGEGTKCFYELSALPDAPQAKLDLIDCNGRLALNVCSVGFDARIGLRMDDFKNIPLVGGSLAYQLSALRTIVEGIHRPYQVEVDGEKLPDDEFTLMCACNGRYYGGGFNPSPDAMPDDGLLDFVIIKGVPRRTILKFIKKYANGGAKDIPRHIIVCRGREIKITCPQPEMVNLDGERIDADVISIRLSAKKVNFFFPEGTHWDPKLRDQNMKTRENQRKTEITAL